MPSIIDLANSGLRRSNRKRTQPIKFGFITALSVICSLGMVLSSNWAPTSTPLHDRAQNLVFATIAKWHTANQCFNLTLNHLHPMALLAGKENNETYTFKEMLKQEDAPQFIDAMRKEVQVHEERDHWEIIHRSQLPPGTKTILSIWSFKRKRFPSGELNKHKARLCAHGGMQTWGVNYWETYAPTVNWISVRFLLVVAEIMQLETKAIDFVLAFPQADLDVPVYMELPAGMEFDGNPNCLLKLKKSLYGLKQASANWHQLLKTALTNRSFVESLSDPCVFIGDKMIVLTYVDDCILISKEIFTLNNFISSLKNGPENFVFTDEGSMSAYLGVEISRLPNNQGFTLTQPYLIERIIKTVNFDLATTKGVRGNTPAT